MTGFVISLWRHPMKSHGREAVQQAAFTPGQTMPGDRIWAVAHEQSKADGSEWVPCANFSRGAKAPQLMAMTCKLLDSGRIILSHPERPDLEFDPTSDTQTFLEWVKPLMPADRAASVRLVRVPGRGMTDADFPSVTLCNMASHRAVEQQLGQDLSIHRWRGNVWFDQVPEWQELDWVGREVQIGEAVFRVIEPTMRCLATTANPETGIRDVDTLGALAHWGHQDFSVQAEVIKGGQLSVGDKVTLL
ncbi:MOSC domain-containing protein [Tropicibacter sp. R16_0]|uniref:MOSC domain-containing protein n=1 Tax=Tropicibacter sp. R16_0 TaxID=2821102 RepID=UPI001ADCDB05|nr:MOSC N-terminal beta barrel domain-containing protein [Tropicibacter sp. R16_0]MBO9451687.1 MOSC domain-containing protein [Tropicibacter sp. R16_0]